MSNISSAADLVAEAERHIKTITAEQALALFGRDDVAFIDIRDVRELEREGKIPGAFHAPRGLLEFWVDPKSDYHKPVFVSGKTLVLFCAAGWRSALAAKTLQDMGLNDVCHIEGGFGAWKAAGGAVERDETSREMPPDNRASSIVQTLSKLGREGRMAEQIAFILEIDKLKQVLRQTPLIDYSRKENDAEHSWQLAMMALVLSEYAHAEVVPVRVLKMVLIHDVVEIDAGDSPAYTGVSKADQFARETVAADRLFGLLPPDLADEFRALWDEFERQKSSDALFARAMDRLQPFLHNYFTDGKMWVEHKIHAGQVRERMAIIGKSTPQLLELVEDLIADAVARGFLLP